MSRRLLHEIFNRNRLGHALQVIDRLPLRRGRLYNWIGVERHTITARLTCSFKVLEPLRVENTVSCKIRGEGITTATKYCTCSAKFRGPKTIYNTVSCKIKGLQRIEHCISCKITQPIDRVECTASCKIAHVERKYCTASMKVERGERALTDVLVTASQPTTQYLYGNNLENQDTITGTSISLFFSEPEIYSIESTPILYIKDVDYTWSENKLVRLLGGSIGEEEEVSIIYGTNKEYEDIVVLGSYNYYIPSIGEIIVTNYKEDTIYTEALDYIFDSNIFRVTRTSGSNIDWNQTVKIHYSSYKDECLLIGDKGNRLKFAPVVNDITIFDKDGTFLERGEHYLLNEESGILNWL